MLMNRQNFVEAGTSAHNVLRLLFEHGPQRQKDIAKHLGITNAASNQHFRKLADETLIKVYGEVINKRGAPSQIWGLCNENNYFMGILFYSRTISVSLIDFAGNLITKKSRSLSNPADSTELRNKLRQTVREIYSGQQNKEGRILQVFIAINGTISRDGTCLHCHHLSGLDGLNLEKELYNDFGLASYCDTSHYAMIQGETKDLPPTTTSLLLNWDEGVGGVITSNQQILNWAGIPANRNRGLWDIGHIPIVKDGVACYCGQRGCLEAYVGGYALTRKIPDCDDMNELIRRIQKNNPPALKIIREAAELLGASLYWLLELFGVDRIVIIGGFASVFKEFKDAFQQGLAQMYTPDALKQIHLIASGNTLERMQLGVGVMARYFFFYPEEPRKCRGVVHYDHGKR